MMQRKQLIGEQMVGWMARDPGNKYTSNRQFDGTISVKSTSVKGSDFTVVLPISQFQNGMET